jgi:hypothetical protein
MSINVKSYELVLMYFYTFRGRSRSGDCFLSAAQRGDQHCRPPFKLLVYLKWNNFTIWIYMNLYEFMWIDMDLCEFIYVVK